MNQRWVPRRGNKGRFTSYELILKYFWRIMEIKWDELDWKPQERVKEMRKIIHHYKNTFQLQAYTDTHIWKIILHKYNMWWDSLHYDYLNLSQYHS